MKKYILNLGVLFLVLFLISCDKNDTNQLSDLEGKALKAEEFFDLVASKKINSDGKALLISYQWNASDNTIIYKSDDWVEPSWGLGLTVGASMSAKPGDKYKVTCTKGDTETTTTCNNQYSCGRIIADCLKEGGCAEICNAKMVYVPEVKTFFLGDDYEKLLQD